MKKILLLAIASLFLSLLLNCKGKDNVSTKSAPLVAVEIIKVEPSSNKREIWVSCEITNNSNNKLYFPIDKNYVRFYSNLSMMGIEGSFFYVFFYDKNDKKIWAGLVSNIYYEDSIVLKHKIDSINKIREKWMKLNAEIMNKRGEDLGYNKGILNREIKKNGFYLNAGESKTVKIRVDGKYSVEKDIFIGDNSYYRFFSEEFKTIQIAVSVDSVYTKNDVLFSEDIDSLHRNNIKIFNGTIYSNKVPLE
jgi:hypothetical protein